MATTTLNHPRLSIYDYADLELLHVIDDHEFTTAEMAEFLERERSSVAQRMTWMKRQLLVDRRSDGVWIVARRGKAILNGRSDSLISIRELSLRAARDPVMGWVAKREWRRNLSR